jgi:hypothetical protein
VDSGILNPELNAAQNGPEAARIWAEFRLRDRVKAVIAHEDIESRGVSRLSGVTSTCSPLARRRRRSRAVLDSLTCQAVEQATGQGLTVISAIG